MTAGFVAAEARMGATWRPDTWNRLVCRATWDETHDVRTFLLVPESGAGIAFDPGQFLTFRMEIDGEIAERCYTLSSSSATPGAVTITVKWKEAGRFSRYLYDAVGPGDVIEAFGPSGQFGPITHAADKYLLLSAGSGITPMMSIVRTAADYGIDFDACFINASRTPNDVVFGDVLPLLQRRLPRLRLFFTTSRSGFDWAGERGRLDGSMLSRLVPDIAERMVLCCGPESFMADMRVAVMERGVTEARYAQESFDFGDVENFEAPAAGGRLRRVTFAKSGRSFTCAEDATILAAAKAAGIPMASSCARGICGTCKCIKLSGDVAMHHNGGIRQREIDRGFVLPCSSKPLSDIVLDR